MNSGSAAFLTAARGPIMLVTLGVLFAVDQFGPYAFWRTWPVLIIVYGLMKLAEMVATRQPDV